MRVLEFIGGIIFAFICTFIGGYLYTQFVVNLDFFSDFKMLFSTDIGSKVIAIGSLLNIPLVYFLLNKYKYDLGKGVIFGLIVLVIISQLI